MQHIKNLIPHSQNYHSSFVVVCLHALPSLSHNTHTTATEPLTCAENKKGRQYNEALNSETYGSTHIILLDSLCHNQHLIPMIQVIATFEKISLKLFKVVTIKQKEMDRLTENLKNNNNTSQQ